MTREEWQRVKHIATAALAEPDATRAAFVVDRCGADQALCSEVESLLASVASAADLFETPKLLVAGATVELERLSELDADRAGERVGAYRLIKQLGAGGMGTAYLAARADDEFQQTVALKLVKRGMDTDAVLRRFRQERQVLANLDHPNIARLLDGGTTAAGLPYFVMEYVEGNRIDVYCYTHQLTVRDRLMLFRSVCDAVQHAHDHRVIHRDLKPANILVTTGGVPKLLDFGISKVLSPDDPTPSESTLMWRAMTPQYASPEQMRGDPITPASDVYALGVILYELLTGHRPYRLDGRTLQEITGIVCDVQPEKPSAATAGPQAATARRQLAGDLDTITLMALRKEPQRRYASARELSDDILRYLEGRPLRARGDDLRYRAVKSLRRHRARLVEAALVVSVLMLAAAWWMRSAPTPGVETPIDSIAVLPFQNAAGGSETEYLSDGVTDALIDSFSHLDGLRVAARSTVFPFKGKPVDPQAIGRDLHVGAVLLGSISPLPTGFSLDVTLADGSDGQRLWRSQYVTTIADLPRLRERITRDVSQALRRAPASREGGPPARARTTNGEAYQLYLKGRYAWNKRTEAGLKQGLDYFRQALDKDPQYAIAFAGLADCYSLLGIWGALPPHEAMPKVKDAARRALALDDSLAEAHTSLAFVEWVYDWNWTAAAAGFQAALDRNPNYATAHEWYAYYLASARRFDEALVHMQRAQELEPVSLSIGTDLGEIFYWSGQYDRAVEQLQSVLQVEPTFAMAHNILGLTYLKMGRVNEAIAELEHAERLSTGPRMLSTLGYAYGVADRRTDARRTLARLRQASASRYTSAFVLAVTHTGLGETDQALDFLEQAFAERSDTMAILRVYPPLDDLRSAPRFRALMQRVGYAPPFDR